ncbi:DMT family transporter [Candidatus Parcubacteria bacterium]|nr:MAG: DMT family transporter [Candidatus Parcubacteria bacterium]
MENPRFFRSATWWDVLVVLAMLIFGFYGVFLKKFSGIPILSFLFFFQLVGALGFLATYAWQGFPRPTKRAWLLIAGLVIVAIGNDLCWFWAQRLTTIANAAVAHQMVSVFMLFIAPRFLGEETDRREWQALMFSLLGIAVLYWGGVRVGGGDLLGISLGLLSALFLAFLIVSYRLLKEHGTALSTVNFWRYTASAVLLFPFALSFGGFGFHREDLVPLLAFGFLFAVVAAGIHSFAIGRARALHSSIIGKSEPVIASLYAFWILGEQPGISTLVGGILIIGSSLWLAFRKKEDS